MEQVTTIRRGGDVPKKQYIYFIAIVLISTSICLYLLDIGKFWAPIAFLFCLYILFLLFNDKVKLMLGWILISPLVNCYYAISTTRETLNAVTYREIFDFDRIIITALFVFTCFKKSVDKNRTTSQKFMFSYLPFLLFSVDLILNSVLLSYNKLHSLRLSIDGFIIPVLGFYVSKELFSTEENFKRFIKTCMILALSLTVMGFIEILYFQDLFRRIRGPFLPMGWDAYGFILCVLAVIILFKYDQCLRLNKIYKIFNKYDVFLASIFLCIFLTLTRAVFLTFFFGFLFFGYKALRLFKYKFIFKKIVITLGLATCILTTFVYLSYPDYLSNVYEGRVKNSDNIVNRLEAYRFGLKQVFRTPLNGIGVRNFMEFYGREAKSDEFSISHPGRATIHNTYLNILVEQGLIGLILFAIVLYSLGRRVLVFSQNNNPIVRSWGYVGMTIFIMFLSSCLFFNPLLSIPFYLTKLFFIIMGTYSGGNYGYLKSYETS